MRAFNIVITATAFSIFALTLAAMGVFFWVMVTDPAALARSLGGMLRAFLAAADLR